MADTLKDRSVRAWRRDEQRENVEASTGAAADVKAPVRRLVRRTPLASPEALAADVRSQALATAAQTRPSPRRPSTSLDAFRARMGQVPDEDIAKEAGVSRGVVGAYRRKHGIAAYEGYLFKPGHVPLTGKPAAERPDATPAGEPSLRRSRIDAFAHLAGVESDSSIAKKAGVTPAAVTAWRHRRGIAAANKPGLPAGKPPLKTSALDAFVHLFGTMSDPEIAERAGLKRDAVIKYRKKHGIPAWHPPPPPARADAEARSSPLDAFVDQMGTMSDAAVAKLAGATREAVGDYRRSKGIAPWQGFRTKPGARRGEVRGEAAPAAAVAAATAAPSPTRTVRRLLAYTVVATANGTQREFIAVGDDIAVACANAQAGLSGRDDGPWTVEAVKLLSEALG